MKHTKVTFEDALSVHPGWLKLMQPESSDLPSIKVNESGRLHVHDLRNVLYQAYEAERSPLLLTRMAQRVGPLTFGGFSTALWTADNLDGMFRVLEKFVMVMSAPVRVKYKLDRQGNAELWVLDTESLGKESKVSFLGITLFVATIIHIIQSVLPRSGVSLEVCLPEHRYSPEDNANLEAATQCRIREGSPIRKLVTPKRFLYEPFAERDKALHFSCVNLLREEAERLKKDDLILQIYQFLNQHHQLGDISGESVAAALNMNIRTLNRHLALQNTSYRGVVEKYKLEKALHLLEAGRVNMTEIAYQLGFSDLSTFSRAFKRWTGSSPLSIRQSAENT
ncbi:AraC family transcriptional regulator [Vibrio sp. CAU 1672]|uniref:helix-turn-helix domain-containing protein n=1 Tax=Vibrio sp. CAU 1672 TaxID=3032594 RepID=UPI0023DAF4FF|nr:AraC family transcriptional regulator [Vibrio sp. CAU 1672]MDF2154612.1 AraC family transcriptional regulator [Vibrio sp. CAU 1672]